MVLTSTLLKDMHATFKSWHGSHPEKRKTIPAGYLFSMLIRYCPTQNYLHHWMTAIHSVIPHHLFLQAKSKFGIHFITLSFNSLHMCFGKYKHPQFVIVVSEIELRTYCSVNTLRKNREMGATKKNTKKNELTWKKYKRVYMKMELGEKCIC